MSNAAASQAAPGLLARKTSPLGVPPPRSTRFGSPLVLSRVHWVEPKLVAEITYLTWTADNLLRHTVYVGLLIWEAFRNSRVFRAP
jgi:ATP-dependent DNA ligase